MKELRYFVKWKGCPEDENTWEPPEGMKNAQEEVERFHRENPEMPGPREVEQHKKGFPSVDKQTPVVFTPTMWSSRCKIDCIIDIEYWGRTLGRGKLVLCARTALT